MYFPTINCFNIDARYLLLFPHPAYRKIQWNEFSKQRSLPFGDGRSCSGPQQRRCPDASFSPPPRTAVLGERGRLFRRRKLFNSRLVRSLAGIRAPLPSPSRLARNQLSASEAACRSSRTLEGICQELHASVPTIRAGVSAPSNLRIAAARYRAYRENRMHSHAIQRRRRDVSPPIAMCANASRRRATINSIDT